MDLSPQTKYAVIVDQLGIYQAQLYRVQLERRAAQSVGSAKRVEELDAEISRLTQYLGFYERELEIITQELKEQETND